VRANAHKRPVRPDVRGEVVRLRALLVEARATLSAIRRGEVDAVVVEGELGPQVYTLDGAEFDYRTLIESMNEGAVVLTRSAVILYANAHFALMVERPLAQLMGRSLYELLSVDDQSRLGRMLKRPARNGTTTEVLLRRANGTPMPAKVSIRRLPDNGAKDTSAKNTSIGLVVSDLTEFHGREELLRRFSHGLMQRQETERQQIATELGDNITQLLCSILVRCQELAHRLPAHESAFLQEVVQFAKLLRTTASEVQRISTDLRPHGLDILGLVSALRGVAAEFAERTGVVLQVTCAKIPTRLPAKAELVLYRVLQEALGNVEQHAQARHVYVSLRRRGTMLQLTIQDDGIGFDTSERRAKGAREGQFGLLSMRERAAAVGGELRVKSSAATGTEVRLSVPLAPEEQGAPSRDSSAALKRKPRAPRRGSHARVTFALGSGACVTECRASSTPTRPRVPVAPTTGRRSASA